MEAVNLLHSSGLRQYTARPIVSSSMDMTQPVIKDDSVQKDAVQPPAIFDDWQTMDVNALETFAETINKKASLPQKPPVNEGKKETLMKSRFRQMIRSQAIVIKFLDKSQKDKENSAQNMNDETDEIVEGSESLDHSESITEKVIREVEKSDKLVDVETKDLHLHREQADPVQEYLNTAEMKIPNSVQEILSDNMNAMQILEAVVLSERRKTVNNAGMSKSSLSEVNELDGLYDGIDMDDGKAVNTESNSSDVFDAITNDMFDTLQTTEEEEKFDGFSIEDSISGKENISVTSPGKDDKTSNICMKPTETKSESNQFDIIDITDEKDEEIADIQPKTDKTIKECIADDVKASAFPEKIFAEDDTSGDERNTDSPDVEIIEGLLLSPIVVPEEVEDETIEECIENAHNDAQNQTKENAGKIPLIEVIEEIEEDEIVNNTDIFDISDSSMDDNIGNSTDKDILDKENVSEASISKEIQSVETFEEICEDRAKQSVGETLTEKQQTRSDEDEDVIVISDEIVDDIDKEMCKIKANVTEITECKDNIQSKTSENKENITSMEKMNKSLTESNLVDFPKKVIDCSNVSITTKSENLPIKSLENNKTSIEEISIQGEHNSGDAIVSLDESSEEVNEEINIIEDGNIEITECKDKSIVPEEVEDETIEECVENAHNDAQNRTEENSGEIPLIEVIEEIEEDEIVNNTDILDISDSSVDDNIGNSTDKDILDKENDSETSISKEIQSVETFEEICEDRAKQFVGETLTEKQQTRSDEDEDVIVISDEIVDDIDKEMCKIKANVTEITECKDNIPSKTSENKENITSMEKMNKSLTESNLADFPKEVIDSNVSLTTKSENLPIKSLENNKTSIEEISIQGEHNSGDAIVSLDESFEEVNEEINIIEDGNIEITECKDKSCENESIRSNVEIDSSLRGNNLKVPKAVFVNEIVEEEPKGENVDLDLQNPTANSLNTEHKVTPSETLVDEIVEESPNQQQIADESQKTNGQQTKTTESEKISEEKTKTSEGDGRELLTESIENITSKKNMNTDKESLENIVTEAFFSDKPDEVSADIKDKYTDLQKPTETPQVITTDKEDLNVIKHSREDISITPENQEISLENISSTEDFSENDAPVEEGEIDNEINEESPNHSHIVIVQQTKSISEKIPEEETKTSKETIDNINVSITQLEETTFVENEDNEEIQQIQATSTNNEETSLIETTETVEECLQDVAQSPLEGISINDVLPEKILADEVEETSTDIGNNEMLKKTDDFHSMQDVSSFEESFVDELLEDAEGKMDHSSSQGKVITVDEDLDEEDVANQIESSSVQEKTEIITSEAKTVETVKENDKYLQNVIDKDDSKPVDDIFQTKIDVDVVSGKILVDTNDGEDDCVFVTEEVEEDSQVSQDSDSSVEDIQKKTLVESLQDHDYGETAKSCEASEINLEASKEVEPEEEQLETEVTQDENNSDEGQDNVIEDQYNLEADLEGDNLVIEDQDNLMIDDLMDEHEEMPLVIDEPEPQSEDTDEPPVLEEEEVINASTVTIPLEKLICTETMDKKREMEMPKLIPIFRKVTTTPRMTIAQLIERKLQNNIQEASKVEKSVDSTNLEPQEIKTKEDSLELAKSTLKKPIIGCVRKSARTSGRLTKPPWLVDIDRQSKDDDNNDDNVENDVPELQEEGLTNGDMREKLASQLQALKVKKTAALIDAKIPNFTKIDYNKRVLKGPKLSNVATLSPSPLGLKIVAVAGGVEEDISDGGLDMLENMMGEESDRSFDSESNSAVNQVIINDHLDLPTIKLTKTKDYKKIKGWSKKKLLTLDDAEGEEAGEVHDNGQPTPGCSYTGSDLSKSETGLGKDIPVTLPESGNVFASNSLDGFLQEKDLNISYNVPNLKSSNSNINLLDACMLVDIEAEKNRSATQPDNEDSNSSSGFKDNEKLSYKPRTLAEKRKMMSNGLDDGDAKKVKKSDKPRGRPKKIQKVDPKKNTIPVEKPEEISAKREVKKSEEKLSLTMKIQENIRILDDEAPKLERVEDKPKVVYLNEEESKPKRCVTSQLRFRSQNKQSIYSVLTRKVINRQFYTKCSDIKRRKTFDLIPIEEEEPTSSFLLLDNVNYKPGPLCKKQELQMSGAGDWETVLMDLPAVQVNVKPEIGKKMPPVVRPFVKFDNFQVSKTRAEFALSVLTSSKPKAQQDNKIFTFPVKYQHNQEKVMMRRLIPKKRSTKKLPRQEESEADILNSCESVISDMLDYVDVKTIEDGLLKYDCDAEKTEEKAYEVFPKEAKPIRGQWRKRPILDKVELELRRLNVRTVNVASEEKMDATPVECTNFHCHLGCVCNSIANKYPPSNHCGEARCIFNCSCGFEDRCRAIQEDTQQETTINERTLSRYNKEAKKNITAKEERDFTQTAIRHKDKTIILGNNRVSKRTPKFNFKRFEGFHFNFNEEKVDRVEWETPINETMIQKIIKTDRKLNNCVVQLVRCNFDEVVPYCLEHNLYDCHCKGLSEYTDKSKPVLEELKPEEPRNKLEPLKRLPHVEDSCSRFVFTGELYRARNRTNRFRNNMGRRLKYEASVNSMEIVNKWVILPTHDSIHKSTKPALVEARSESVHDLIVDDDQHPRTMDNSSRKRKRKVPHTIVPDPPPAKSKPKTLRVVGSCLTISGALYSPTEAISRQFSAMIGYKSTPLTEFRLLLWPSMIQLYENKEIHIWISSNTNKLRFIITDSLSNPKGAYTNIRTYEKADYSTIKVEFIKWIVSKSMPDRKNSNNILVILRIQDMFWEICGICAKNAQNQNNGTPEIAEVTQDLHPSGTPKETIQTVDEKYYKTVQHVVFANGSFALKQLALENKEDCELGETKMAAALPHIISNCKWRVLKVNSNFAILAFSRNEFRIKCSDILTVMKVAGKYDKTIIINTAEVSKNYQHKLFGIYIPPTFQDRIFIGPYFKDEDHGLETLRFVNNELMNTEAFNVMRGIKNVATTGLWYQQVGRASEPPSTAAVAKVPVSDSVIDLTDMDEVMNLMQSSDVTITPTPLALNAKVQQPEAIQTEIITKQPEHGKTIQTTASLLIPCLQPDKTVKYQHVKLNLAPNVTKSARGFEHINVDQLDQPEATPSLPALAPLSEKPVEPKKRKIDVEKSDNMYEKKQSMLDTIALNNIIAHAKSYTPDELESCFTMRLMIIFRQMKLAMPRSANPICFRLNFGNGIILAYTHNNQVFVFWPGDCQKQFCFLTVYEAVEWLIRELHEVFICVPSTFRIMVTPVGPSHYLEYINRGIISQKYFKEICIIGDFGIMRLSEAEKYLMFDDPQVAQRCLRMTTDKSLKFKRAVGQIIDCNDMTKLEFQRRVQDLIKRAKAAADPQHAAGTSLLDANKRKLTPATIATPPAAVSNDVICLDSDDDMDATPAASSQPSPKTPTPLKTKKIVVTKAMLQQAKFKNLKIATPTSHNDVVQIDLTHMTTEKVRELLKGHEYGDSIALTKAEVKRLRALSRKSPSASKTKRNGHG